MERRVLQESPDEAVIPQKQVGCFLYPVIFLSVLELLQNLWALNREKKGVIIKY